MLGLSSTLPDLLALSPHKILMQYTQRGMDGGGRTPSRHDPLHRADCDYILYTTYERQVEAHFSGPIHIAWNSPVAWLQSERLASVLGCRAEAICIRDTDRDPTSVVTAHNNDTVLKVADLKGRRVAVGAGSGAAP